MNRSEELVLRELESVASDNNLRVFPKVRFSDVVQKDGAFLTQREFDSTHVAILISPSRTPMDAR